MLADSTKALGNKVDASSVQKVNGTSSSSPDLMQSDRPWKPQDREAIQHLTVVPLQLSLPVHPTVALHSSILESGNLTRRWCSWYHKGHNISAHSTTQCPVELCVDLGTYVFLISE
ncbi:hypothetical protein CDL15_Pgr019613 [Punica granatum]|uniref:Uncharacterized protein n=1 Tax=Punica granatum TaxID=22663 RepID=A0A218X5Y6_PUNGR|nr:hypothetical protein CDL15_Pgr019613 [Punica granatum]